MNYKLYFVLYYYSVGCGFLFTFVINLHYKVIHNTNIIIRDTLKFLIQKYLEKSDNHSPEKPNHIIPVSYQVW